MNDYELTPAQWLEHLAKDITDALHSKNQDEFMFYCGRATFHRMKFETEMAILASRC